MENGAGEIGNADRPSRGIIEAAISTSS
jgi:hypothetical protein